MNYTELIKSMTLEEKASLLSGKDFWQTMNLKKHGIPSIFLADGPHGLRKQAAAADHMGLNQSIKSTCFPTSATMANTWDTELAERVASHLGVEAVAQRVNVILGPGLNIKRNPLCGRNFEYYSEDPYLAGKMAAAAVRGIQSSGVSACLKHFAVNSQEERRMVIDSVIDERTLREIYLTAFEIAIKEGGAKTIMTSYNPLNGTYTNENEHLLVDILRNEWGYNGVIVTDWGGNNDRVAALKAGNELEMPTTGGETNRDVVAAVREGRLSEEYLDKALERLLPLIFSTYQVEQGTQSNYFTAHHEVAREAAEAGIVMLKNQSNALPITIGKKVAVIGDFAKNHRYQGAGSSIVNPTRLDIPLNVLKEQGVNIVGYQQGFKRFGKKSSGLIKKALKLAETAEVVLLYVGLDEMSETEGMERSNMRLPSNQLALISALSSLCQQKNKRLIALLSCGSAIEMDWADSVDAVLHCYLGGQAGANAAVNVLLGRVNPSGKLSESYPIRYADLPNADIFPAKEMTAEYRESIFVGYRYFQTADVAVKYPFGFGLSYTTFAYSNLIVSDNGVRFTVENTGSMDGREVCQLYISKPSSRVFRAKTELKGFKKVFVKAGQQVEVEIPFDEYTFRYFNVATNKWEIEGGTYDIMVGSSSESMELTSTLSVKGSNPPDPYNAKELPSYFSGRVKHVGLEEFELLLGRKAPSPSIKFIKPKRIKADYNTAISDLRYACGWTGRLLSGGLRFVYALLRGIGQRKLANVMMLGMYHMPLRGLSRMTGGALSTGQLDGVIIMFNGEFFKGFSKYCKEGKIKKRRIKAEKKAIKRGDI